MTKANGVNGAVNGVNGHHDDGTDLVVRTIRWLVADLVQAYKGGHPGTAMGAAPIGVAVWRDVLKYNPKNPLWFGRDRYVLSVGHACLHQYIMLMLTRTNHWDLDMVKRYHSPEFVGSLATGHPEIEQDAAIELTTGLLGQGICNAVGMAMASKHIQATYSREGFDKLFDNRIVCMVGDGCLQEGPASESISIAGHMGLDNLTVIYDQNAITVDGHIDTVFTEDQEMRFKSARWNVLTCKRGDLAMSQYVQAISKTLKEAREHKGQPTLVIIPTIIGEGSVKQSDAATHGAALGAEDVVQVKKTYGFNPEEYFVVPEAAYEHFQHKVSEGQALEDEWNKLFAEYKQKHGKEAAELERRLSGKLPENWRALLPSKDQLPTAPQATRKSSGIAVQALAPAIPDLMIGSADLMAGTFVNWKGMTEFQKPDSGYGDYSGRQIRYGIREHAMMAVANGMVAYFPQHGSHTEGGGITAVAATYYIFFSYAVAAIRMGAMQRLRSITIATHDSLGVGEDGPTHQPVGLSNFFRSEPGIRLYRPADVEEVLGAWQDALGTGSGPSVICLTRQNVPLLHGSDRDGVAKGAYIVQEAESEDANIILVATGSEVSLAIEVAELLAGPAFDMRVRVVSMPCMENFVKQPREYRRKILPSHKVLTIGIEAWSSFGWARFCHASANMSTFGLSGPYAKVFEHFGFTANKISESIGSFVKRHSNANGSIELPGCGEYEELLYEHQQSVFHIETCC